MSWRLPFYGGPRRSRIWREISRGWVAAVRQSKKLRALSIVSVWFILASAQLITVGKSGAWDNYFVEWMCITTVPIGMAATVAWAGVANGGKSARLSGLAGLFLTLALAKHALDRPPFEPSIVDDPRATALRAHLVDVIRESPRPVLSDDMVLLLRAGQQVPIEPSIFTELASTGYWDQGPFFNLILEGCCALRSGNNGRIDERGRRRRCLNKGGRKRDRE